MEPFGGFICSASHNPGGINDDFGIKYNCENGGPAPEKLTDKMVEWTAKLSELKTCSRIPDFDLSKPQTYELPGGKLVEIFDCVEDHMAVLKQCFDFESIKKLMVHPEFSMTYDSMSGVQGPYALGILEGPRSLMSRSASLCPLFFSDVPFVRRAGRSGWKLQEREPEARLRRSGVRVARPRRSEFDLRRASAAALRPLTGPQLKPKRFGLPRAFPLAVSS